MGDIIATLADRCDVSINTGSPLFHFDRDCGKDFFHLKRPENRSPADYAIHSGRSEPAGRYPGCLTERQLESHPLILKDGERLHSVATNGPQIEIFRGVSEGSLRSFAAQGDSAAMAVLGARAVMRALGLDEQRAVPWLQFEDVNMETMLPGKTFSEPALFELDEAARWFYRAAMHGRLYALRNYGEVIAARHGGPVGLGWIEDEDFRSLSSRERSALYPSNVYQNVANGIAPQLTEGALGWFGNFLTFRTEREQTIRTRVTDEFHEASVAADLPPTVVADTASPDLEVLFSQACASVIDERLRREAPED
jgi:hypothetical protein